MWEEALAYARTLAQQSPDEYITVHPHGTSDRAYYRVLPSGEIEKIKNPDVVMEELMGGDNPDKYV